MTTTSTMASKTTVESDLSAASEELRLSIEDMKREIPAADCQRREVARVSRIRGEDVTERVDEFQVSRRAEQ